MRGGTVRALLDLHGGRAPGFDALRLMLAAGVLLSHSVSICYGHPAFVAFWRAPVAGLAAPLFLFRMLVPMFFFISGFLVTASALRLRRPGTYLCFRALRVFPALLVSVAACAVVLGGAVTVLPLSAYYTDPGFFSYFLNILGSLRTGLPGVFADHPVRDVNRNLWTLEPEFLCYLVIAVLLWAGVLSSRRAFLALYGLGSAWLALMLPFIGWGGFGDAAATVHPWIIMHAFFTGALAFLYADRVRVDGRLMGLALLGLLFLNGKYTLLPGTLAACYVALCVGFMPLRGFPLTRKGDLSYGLYIYGYPVQQAVFHASPLFRTWWAMDLVALPLALLAAALSWRFIEAPALALKRRISPAAPAPAPAFPPSG